MKVIADAGERLDSLGGDAVQVVGRIAEPFGQAVAKLKMKFPVRVVGDPAVHFLDLAFQGFLVHLLFGGCGFVGHAVPPSLALGSGRHERFF